MVGILAPGLPGIYAWVSATISLCSLYTCVLESPLGQTARKWLQLATFCSPLAPGQTHLQLRVYFLNNTPCALQWAITNEQPHGGRLRGPCQLFDFTGARADQCLKLKYISEGERGGPQGVGAKKLHEREGRSPPLACQKIQKPQDYFLGFPAALRGPSGFLRFPLSPTQATSHLQTKGW